MSQATYRETVLSDLADLAPRLREMDKLEVTASTGSADILGILEEGFEVSAECYTIIKDGEILGVFGVREYQGNGIPWMLAAEGVEKFAKTFIKCNRLMLRDWLKTYPILHNFVDCRNEVAIKWLQFLGFVFIRKVILNDPEAPFYEFVRI